MRIDSGEASYLTSGDLEVEAIESLLAKHLGTNVRDADVWQVSHHGAHNGLTKELLDALSPEMALVGTGSEDRHVSWSVWAYGQRRKNMIDFLREALTLTRDATSKLVATKAKTFRAEEIAAAVFANGMGRFGGGDCKQRRDLRCSDGT